MLSASAPPPGLFEEEEKKEVPKEKKKLISECTPLVQHIALLGGLNENDPADTLIDEESIIKGLLRIGESQEEAEKTASHVITAASVVCFKLTKIFSKKSFTAEELLALMHSARHTGVWDEKGNVRQAVLDELKLKANPPNDPEGLIPQSILYKFRAERFIANQEANPRYCCPVWFAQEASNREFASFFRLYPDPTRTIKIDGREEKCNTLQELLDFYGRPFVSAAPVIQRVIDRENAKKTASTLMAAH